MQTVFWNFNSWIMSLVLCPNWFSGVMLTWFAIA
jgi:hypothetical protein